MPQTVEVVDREGWRRVYPLQKAIIHIGSAPGNDIVLDTGRGGGVAPRHIQLIGGVGGAGYRLINMGDSDLVVGDTGRAIAPRSFVDLANGLQVRLGEYTLTFNVSGALPTPGPAGASAAPMPVSGAGPIGLALSLPSNQLAPNESLEGAIVVRNLGEKPGVQFKIQVEGLEPDWYEIGPGPVLFPGASKEVEFRLHHPGRTKPGAGEHRFIVRATAPAAYPSQSAMIAQTIQIMPLYSHKLRIITTD